MTEKQLEIFLVVANNLNISKAAEELYTSQPYVSRQIATLEEELGVELFVRKNRFMGLTDSGTELYNGTKELIEQRSNLIKNVKNLGKIKDEHISMGYMHVMFTGTLPDLINEYKEQNKNVKITMEAKPSKDIIEGLNNKHFDMGMTLTMGREIPEHLHIEHLSTSKLYIALLENHSLAKNKFLTLDKISNENIIFLPKEMSPYTFQNTKNPFAVESKRFRHQTFAENMFNAISLVKVGVGITSIAKDFSFHSHEDLVFIPVEGVNPIDFSIIWRKDNKNSNIPVFVEHIKDKSQFLLVY